MAIYAKKNVIAMKRVHSQTYVIKEPAHVLVKLNGLEKNAKASLKNADPTNLIANQQAVAIQMMKTVMKIVLQRARQITVHLIALMGRMK